MQMDAKGSKCECICTTSLQDLDEFAFIAIELHDLNLLSRPESISRTMREAPLKLDNKFVCIYASGNNRCGDVMLAPIGLNIPRYGEFTFLNKRLFETAKREKNYTKKIIKLAAKHKNLSKNKPLILYRAWYLNEVDFQELIPGKLFRLCLLYSASVWYSRLRSYLLHALRNFNLVLGQK